MNSGCSEEIIAAVNDFFVENNWNFNFYKEAALFGFNVSVDNAMKQIHGIVEVKEDEYIVYGIAPVNADVDNPVMMANMAEYITKVNYDLLRGNFEMDYNDGEIRFRNYVDCADRIPSGRIVSNSICTAVLMYGYFAQSILDIINGGNPQEAYERSKRAVEKNGE